MPPMELVAGISPKQAAWVGIVKDLGVDYPASSYSKLSAEQVTATGCSWAKHLVSIPIEHMEEVYKRVVLSKADRAPAIGDFEIAWGAMARENWEREEERRMREHEALKKQRGLDPNHLLDMAPTFASNLRRAPLGAVCHCDGDRHCSSGKKSARLFTVQELIELGRDHDYSGLDYHSVGTNQNDPAEYGRFNARYWACASGACSYIALPQSIGAKESEVLSLVQDGPQDSRGAKAPAGPRQPHFVDRVAESWSVDMNAMSPLQLTEFCSFCNWWSREFGDKELPTQEDFALTEEEWKADRDARREKLLAGVAA